MVCEVQEGRDYYYYSQGILVQSHCRWTSPQGWDAGCYGISPDIMAQTDCTTLWALVCTAEALNSGITDSYEPWYKRAHPSEVGTSLGSGMGGTESLAKMFKDCRDEKKFGSLSATLTVRTC